jgi:hypothetical protein
MPAAIKLIGFTGEQPRLLPRLLPPTGATATLDARLDDGGLSPYRSPQAVLSLLGDGPFNTIYRFAGEWLSFLGTVHLAPGPVAEDRLYYTGDSAPKMRVGATIYPLAVPRPTAAPTAATGGAGSGDFQTRAYVYTFVTTFGEEGEPCPASNEVNWQSGQTVTLSGVQNAPASPARGVTKQRFYRSQTGSIGTDFYFIAERDVSNTNFVDNIAADAFAEPLPSRHFNAPPDTLTGLIALPNGMMAAFSGRKLYFSEPYQPHAWPEIYVQTTDTPIVALAATGTSIWVLTEGSPYAVTGSSPDAMVMDKVEANFPCINARGVVDLGYAVAWPTHEGLAVAGAGGAPRLATVNIFSPQEWQQLNPRAMNASQVSGRWIGSYTAADENGQDISGSLIIDLTTNSFLIRSSVKARAWFYDLNTAELFFLDGKVISQFDPPSGSPMALFWKSKPFVLSKPDNLGVILVEAGQVPSAAAIAARAVEIAAIVAARAAAIAAGPVGGALADAVLCGTTVAGDLLPLVPSALSFELSVGVIADGTLVASIGTVDQVKRLPSGFKARTWEVSVQTNAEIAQITLARTTSELKQVPSG